jgi:hypothetical protein
MPGGDRTGPLGLGQKTGRGAGYCSGSSKPGYINIRPGYKRGFGRGLNRGDSCRIRGLWGRGFFDLDDRPQPNDLNISSQPTSKKEEKAHLDEIVNDLKEEIKKLKKQIQEQSKEKK